MYQHELFLLDRQARRNGIERGDGSRTVWSQRLNRAYVDVEQMSFPERAALATALRTNANVSPRDELHAEAADDWFLRHGYLYDSLDEPTDTDILVAEVLFGDIEPDTLTPDELAEIVAWFDTMHERPQPRPAVVEASGLAEEWARIHHGWTVDEQVDENPSAYLDEIDATGEVNPYVRDAFIARGELDLVRRFQARAWVRHNAGADSLPMALLGTEADAETLSVAELDAAISQLSELTEQMPPELVEAIDDDRVWAFDRWNMLTENADDALDEELPVGASDDSSAASEASPRTGDAVDFVPTTEVIPPSGEKSRARANMAAIELINTLDSENRWATPEEQRILAGYSGWGACANIFNETDEAWVDDRLRLQNLVSKDTYSALRATTTTAFYTEPSVTEAMWNALRTAGLDSGTVLEPGSGTGNFIGTAPDGVSMVGVEQDPIASAISQQLYPSATVINDSYTATGHAGTRSFAAAIGNVPFAAIPISDYAFNPNRHSLHNYFIAKSTQLVAPGGYVALITSSYTSDALTATARRDIIDHADLITAARLPNDAFTRVAGTSVLADVLVFRIREEGSTPTERSMQWLGSDYMTVDGTSVRINNFFQAHPDHILGDLAITSGRYGAPGLNVAATGDLASQINDILTRDVAAAVENGQGLTAQPAAFELESFHVGATDIPLPGAIEYDRAPDGTYSFRQWDTTGQWQPITPQRKALASQWVALIDLRDTTAAMREAYRDGDEATIAATQQKLHDQYDSYVDAHGPINRFEKVPSATPPKKERDRIFHDLAADWRLANGYDEADPLPSDVDAALHDEAAQPRDTGKKKQDHLRRLTSDPRMATVLGLEKFNDETQTATKAAIFSEDPARRTTTIEHTDNLADAVAAVYALEGSLNLSRIAEVTDRTVSQVTQDLVEEGIAFRDPESPESFIRSTEYLSGFVRDKLATARIAASGDPRFAANVEALTTVQPERIETGITVRPGATWVPHHYYKQFAEEKFGLNTFQRIKVTHDGNAWNVSTDRDWWTFAGKADLDYGLVCANNRDGSTFNFSATGAARDATNQGVACSRNDGVAVTAYETFEAVLNLSAPKANWSKAWREEKGIKEGQHGQATAFLARKAKRLEEDFSEWIMSDPERRNHIVDIYNETFNSFVAPQFDGTHRQLPGLGNRFEPYSYQRNAVERIVSDHSVLLNHVVGAGKTGTMLMGAAELKRLGIAKQPWIVVPNHIAEQMTREATQWYPDAKVLSAAGVSNREDRLRFVAQTTADDWDIVIVPESVFGLIPVDKDTRVAYLDAKIEEQRLALNNAQAAEVGSGKSPSVKQMETALAKLKTAHEKLLDSDKDPGMEFNQTPCDYLFVDEAHGFKNLMRQSPVSDLNHPGNEKTADLDMKLGLLRDRNAEAGVATAPVVTFATGTPIANNLAEIWVMMKYLRPDLTSRLHIDSIGQFGATFTEQVADVEVKASGSGLKQVVRTASYMNMAELAATSAMFMDVVGREQITAKVPELVTGNGNRIIEFEPEQEVQDLIADLGVRAEHDWDANPRVNASEYQGAAIDNPLKIANDGRNATLDPKLAGLTVDGFSRRVEIVSDTIIDQWEKTRHNVYTTPDGSPAANPGGLQIVFCDRGTPKADGSYSLYGGLRDALVAKGMNRDRIAFVHDWDSNKGELYEKCNSGEFDVLIGSTGKMGTGANIQTRAVALHHVDVPWKPADLEQREGRIIRQGNQNDQVEIFNYIATGTYDAVMWQTIYRKQRFISQFHNADKGLRRMDALADTSAEQAAAQNKAIATGDTRYVDLLNLDKQVADLEGQRQEWKTKTQAHRFSLDKAQYELAHLQKHEKAMAPLVERAQAWNNCDSDDHTWTLPAQGSTNDRAVAASTITRTLAEVAYARRDDPTPLVNISGIDIHARYQYGEIIVRDATESVDLTLSISEIASALEKTSDTTTSQKAYGLLSRIGNRVGAIPNTYRTVKMDIDTVETTISKLEAEEHEQEFSGEDQLEKALTTRDALREELRKESTSPEAKRMAAERQARLAARGRKPLWSLQLSPTQAYAEVIAGTDKPETVVKQAKVREADALLDHGMIDQTQYDQRLRDLGVVLHTEPDADIDYSVFDDDTLTEIAISHSDGLTPRFRDEMRSRGLAISESAQPATPQAHAAFAQRIKQAFEKYSPSSSPTDNVYVAGVVEGEAVDDTSLEQ